MRLRRAMESEDVSAVFRETMSKWKKSRALYVSEGISETTAQNIANAVINNLERGLSQSELRNSLIELGESPSRASMIARTETHTAVMEAEGELTSTIADQLGLKLNKTWIAVSDNRTRPTHVEASGQTVPQDSMFKVGDAELRWPGDAEGPLEEIINCRCVLGWDENT